MPQPIDVHVSLRRQMSADLYLVVGDRMPLGQRVWLARMMAAALEPVSPARTAMLAAAGDPRRFIPGLGLAGTDRDLARRLAPIVLHAPEDVPADGNDADTDVLHFS